MEINTITYYNTIYNKMNLKNLILFNILLPVFTLLRTGSFGWVHFKGNDIHNRISSLYRMDGDSTDDALLRAVKRVSKLEEENSGNSDTVLMEAYKVEDDGACGFIGIEEEDKFIVFTGIILQQPDIRGQALFELKQNYNVDTIFVSGKRWMLDYSLLL